MLLIHLPRLNADPFYSLHWSLRKLCIRFFWFSADTISRRETMECPGEKYSAVQIKFDLPTQLYYTIAKQNIIKLVYYFTRKPD